MLVEMREHECKNLLLDTIVDKINIITKIGVPTFQYIEQACKNRILIYNIDRGVIYDVTSLPLKHLDFYCGNDKN
ncbi:MAG: hypothetical protein HQK98_01925 [Nitrospirae bacterium]|nr:hypothetical protein [Nitrospirota bacterium]